MNRRNLEKKKVCADISFQRMETTFVEISAISYRRRKLRKEVGWRRRRRRRRRRRKGYSTDNYPKIITTRKDYPRANTFIHDRRLYRRLCPVRDTLVKYDKSNYLGGDELRRSITLELSSIRWIFEKFESTLLDVRRETFYTYPLFKFFDPSSQLIAHTFDIEKTHRSMFFVSR